MLRDLFSANQQGDSRKIEVFGLIQRFAKSTMDNGGCNLMHLSRPRATPHLAQPCLVENMISAFSDMGIAYFAVSTVRRVHGDPRQNPLVDAAAEKAEEKECRRLHELVCDF
ncbi:hypothetical protein [Caballeronia choica]|uniref:hypothetical protein n=1 Tax=Caballeronia choica TaxID=326476 RepID=UPI000B3E8DF0|nr:hypothetical protein [Caballeronia choica]